MCSFSSIGVRAVWKTMRMALKIRTPLLYIVILPMPRDVYKVTKNVLIQFHIQISRSETTSDVYSLPSCDWKVRFPQRVSFTGESYIFLCILEFKK